MRRSTRVVQATLEQLFTGIVQDSARIDENAARATRNAELMDRARDVARRAYAPYSHFRVGAALKDASGAVYVGCNVESASYGLTICAERNAIFAAIAAGATRPFVALAVSCIDATDGGTPCGACRQILSEHLEPDAPIDVDGVGEFRITDLLPYAFSLKPIE
jgi:cytidine deaminase